MISQPSEIDPWRHRYIACSLLSDIWQRWCQFCREVIISSCSGTVTRAGVRVPARAAVNDWKRIAYEANQARFGRRLDPHRVVSAMRQEPTWGDQNTLLTVLPVLSPSNLPTLQAGFGLPVYGPKHIQCVRNACAHTNSETVSEVRRLFPYYYRGSFSHPIDILWWTEQHTAAPAIFFWISELETLADQVTR